MDSSDRSSLCFLAAQRASDNAMRDRGKNKKKEESAGFLRLFDAHALGYFDYEEDDEGYYDEGYQSH